MLTQGFADQESSPQTALCGFRRCREPLPPPGPRGGRPYEFCPEKTWPGGKSCKQLAAAEQALREALGEEGAPTVALQEAGDAFGQAAAAVTEPLRTLSNALDAITARLREEVATATTRADAAEHAAREAEGQRDVALGKAEAAEQAAREADDLARAAEQARELAETTAEQALAARLAAQLEQTRAEAATSAITRQAEVLTADVAKERARSDQANADLATRTQELAVNTAERDAALAALVELRERSSTVEGFLTAQNTELGAEVAKTRAQLSQAEERNQALVGENRKNEAELHTRVGETQAELARAHGHLDLARAEIAQLAERHDQVGTVLSLVRGRVVEAAAEQSALVLRDDVLAILLGDIPAQPEKD